MDIAINLIKMVGGLVLLIYGMSMLSTNLKKIAGEKLKSILKKATDNVFKGIITGIIVTAAVQSSSIVTVMVVGFVNAEILKLKNAIPIIMGANVGTTVTAQILRLASLEGNSIFTLLSPNVLAPIFIIIGFILLELKKKQKMKDIGQLLIGVGLLFTGLMTMVDMASSFSELPILAEILTKLSNPILGLIAGAVITAIVQSSAATVGILQAISQTGIITYASTIPIILGQNIGTCFTSLLSSIGASRNAKRVAMVHLLFNFIGSMIFMIAIYTYQGLVGFSFWNNTIDMGEIANFHLIFNVVCTILLLPCTGLLEKLATLAVKDKNEINEDDEDSSEYLTVLNVLDERITNIPSVAISNSLKVISKTAEIAEKNFRRCMKLLERFDPDRLEHIQEREDAIDQLDAATAGFLVKIGNLELTEQENKSVTSLIKIESELEKIGDYTYKLSKLIENMNNKELKFSEIANKELNLIYNIAEDVLTKTIETWKNGNLNIVIEIQALKEIAEMYREKFKKQHIERLKDGKCSVDTGIAFIEILSVYEKIIDHCANITIAATNYKGDEEYITKHEYLNMLYAEEGANLKEKFNSFIHKYEMLLENNE